MKGQVEGDRAETKGRRNGRITEGKWLEDGESGKYDDINGVNSDSNDINHVYCTSIGREDTLIHWAISDLCSRTRKVLLLGSESKARCAHFDIDLGVFVLH